MNKTLISSLIALSILISGCNVGASTSTTVPTLTVTETAKIIARLVPTGQPASEWNGIPIMTGAIAGEEKDGIYRFTTSSSREEIQLYYKRELSQRGWELTGIKEGNADALLLIFSMDEDTVSISILPDQNKFLVIIIK